MLQNAGRMVRARGHHTTGGAGTSCGIVGELPGPRIGAAERVDLGRSGDVRATLDVFGESSRHQ